MRRMLMVGILLLSACTDDKTESIAKQVSSDCWEVGTSSGGWSRFCRWKPDERTTCYFSTYKDTISCLRD